MATSRTNAASRTRKFVPSSNGPAPAPPKGRRVRAVPVAPDTHFLFWKPGGAPRVEPRGMAWRLDSGNDLVLNVHLRPSGKPENVRPIVGLYFTAEAPTRAPMLVKLENDRALDIPP